MGKARRNSAKGRTANCGRNRNIKRWRGDEKGNAEW
jgi:hypothetical protein